MTLGKKIAKIMRENPKMDSKQAVAIAYSMLNKEKHTVGTDGLQTFNTQPQLYNGNVPYLTGFNQGNQLGLNTSGSMFNTQPPPTVNIQNNGAPQTQFATTDNTNQYNDAFKPTDGVMYNPNAPQNQKGNNNNGGNNNGGRRTMNQYDLLSNFNTLSPTGYGMSVGSPSYYANMLGKSTAWSPQGLKDANASNGTIKTAGIANAIRGVTSGLGLGLATTKDFLTGFGQENVKNYLIAEQMKNTAMANKDYQKQLTEQDAANNGYLQDSGKKFGAMGGIIMANGGTMPSEEEMITGEKTTGVQGAKQQAMANAELEGGEFLKTPQGMVTQVEGEKHTEGGEQMQLPANTKILSDQLTLEKDFSKSLNELFDIKTTPKDTYSGVLEKIKTKIGLTDVYKEQQKYIEKLKENESVTDEKTKKFNEIYLSEKINEIEIQKQGLLKKMDVYFDLLLNEQEEYKEENGIKDGGECDCEKGESCKACGGSMKKGNGGNIKYAPGTDGTPDTTGELMGDERVAQLRDANGNPDYTFQQFVANPRVAKKRYSYAAQSLPPKLRNEVLQDLESATTQDEYNKISARIKEYHTYENTDAASTAGLSTAPTQDALGDLNDTYNGELQKNYPSLFDKKTGKPLMGLSGNPKLAKEIQDKYVNKLQGDALINYGLLNFGNKPAYFRTLTTNDVKYPNQAAIDKATAGLKPYNINNNTYYHSGNGAFYRPYTDAPVAPAAPVVVKEKPADNYDVANENDLLGMRYSGRETVGDLSFMNRNRIPPSPLDLPYLEQAHLLSMSPVKVSPEEAIRENSKALFDVGGILRENVGEQQSANVANLVGKVFQANNNAVANANQQNAQYKMQADMTNLNAQDKYFTNKEAHLADYDRNTSIAVAHQNEEERNYWDAITQNALDNQRMNMQYKLYETLTPNQKYDPLFGGINQSVDPYYYYEKNPVTLNMRTAQINGRSKIRPKGSKYDHLSAAEKELALEAYYGNVAP